MRDYTIIANAFVREAERERKEKKETLEWMMTVVNDVLGNDDLCSGCKDGEERSCSECRRIVADKIIDILAHQLN